MGTTTRRELMALGEVIELGTLHVTFLDRRDGVDLGDSGGTWTEAGRDRDGPIIAVTSLIVPALSIGTETFLWAGVSPGIGRNVDWIWATIAETPGTCVLGPRSPTPGAPEPDCVVAGEVMPDTDGDGLPDEHDLCPRLDGRNTIRAPRTTDTAGGVTGQHQDDDGAFVIDFVGDDCDPYPTLCDWTDRDDDTVPDSVDNCPDEPNRSQENCGGDPRGDACEDDDADGRTDSCGLDNCPPDPARPDVATYNPDQLNCNEDAELAIGTVARGDACDAVPCADTVLQTRDIAGGPGAPAMRVQDQVWIDGVSTVPQDARAGMRFCACPGAASNDVETRQRCGRVVGCRISAGPYTEIETPLQPWRHTTLDYGSGDSGPPIALFVSANEAATSYAPAAGPFRRDLVATWRQEIDFARWSPIYGSPASTDAPGVVWTHTPGGSDAALFAPAVRALSSHYWSGDVAPPHRLVPAAPFPGPFIAAFLGPDVCLECDSSFPAAFITIDSVGDPWVDVRGSLVPVALAFSALLAFANHFWRNIGHCHAGVHTASI